MQRTIRHKVISREDTDRNAEERTIRIAPLPPTPIEHGMAGASLLADIILGKYLYHLPFHRQINRFREFGLRLPASTIGDWYEKYKKIRINPRAYGDRSEASCRIRVNPI